MASMIDMSLDDIIQKKKKEKSSKLKKNGNQQPSKQSPKIPILTSKKLPLADARNKIISKKRVQITDAREKLAELAKKKDARLKLNKLRQERARYTGTGAQAQGRLFVPNRGKFIRTLPSKAERVFVDPTRQVVYQTPGALRIQNRVPINPNKFLETRTLGNKFYDRTTRMERTRPTTRPIVRTVKNDTEIIDDPMDEEYSSLKPTLHNRKASLQLKIIAHNDAVGDRFSSTRRSTVPVRELSPPRPPSILKKRPMAALRSEQIIPKIDKPPLEYRIIVSNLRNTVTGGDIEELFGDIGGMIESRLVRPGTAEVIYKTQEDAQKAVDLYHNRQLDGQPMNCLLVTPRSPNAAMQRSSTKPALYSTNSNVEPDATTFLKVMFNNHN